MGANTAASVPGMKPVYAQCYDAVSVFERTPTNMRCLDRNREMTNYEAHQVAGEIAYCSQEEAGNGPSAKICPRCNLTLHKVKFLGATDIVLGRCENCGGFWLDGGHLEKIDNELSKIMPVSGKGFADFLTNTHLPHWHARIKRDSAETDFSVAVLPVRQAELVGASSHQCPVCHQALDIYKTYGIRIEACPGVSRPMAAKRRAEVLKDRLDADSWGSLRWMNDEVESIERTSAIASHRACLECQSSLLLSTRFANSKIVIDWCRICHGTWLDRGEFEAVAQYLRDELDHLTSKEAERKVIAEVKKIWIGNSESKIAEILDTKAAISTLALLPHPYGSHRRRERHHAIGPRHCAGQQPAP
jgi:Zn-finger nucleic acid-binding protein